MNQVDPEHYLSVLCDCLSALTRGMYIIVERDTSNRHHSESFRPTADVHYSELLKDSLIA